MGEDRVDRRLAAIMAGDIAGYSRLMGADEEGTLRQLKGHRKELVDPKITEHRGRIVKTTGDGVLVEFGSAVDAVRCAVEIQRGMAERTAGMQADQRIQFRIGINVGDIISDDNDIFGDGVNVAARLQALAEPGGICVARTVHDQVCDKLSFGFEDMGDQAVKNIVRPVRAYRIEIEGGAPAPARAREAVFRRPAVAVLPFDNLTRDPEQEYFADGLTEDIITALSHWKTFPVIARNSTFTYKGQPAKVQQVAKELGARYVIEGSVRKGGNQVRIAVQLIDADTGHHVWAERYDRRIDDIFEVQDEITERIACTIAPELERAERARSTTKPPGDLEAWDCYLRGMAALHEFTKEGNARARAMFERAQQLDPGYSRNWTGFAYSHYRDAFLAFSDDREQSISASVEAAQKAIALDDGDALAHFVLSRGLQLAGRIEAALREARLAIELNPNDSGGHASLGALLVSTGAPDEGIAELQRALQLSPKDPRAHIFLGLQSASHFLAGRYVDAAAYAREALSRQSADPAARVLLAASLATAGNATDAKVALDAGPPIDAAHLERLWVIDWLRPADRDRIRDALRSAGWDGGGAAA
ncbi:MAG: adenylate/guanylate cyclase domain-containing protein [Burkholderiales bacterium]